MFAGILCSRSTLTEECKVKEHPNFYENIEEARMRIRATIVMYDNEPYHVLDICNHMVDGIFRVYLSPVGKKTSSGPQTDNFAPAAPGLGTYLDGWIAAHPDAGYLRKRMDSKNFNKFRPFPLGMCNFQSGTYYLERQPVRHREQGLTRAMVFETYVSASWSPKKASRQPGTSVDLYTPAFVSCIKADHPTAKDCLVNLLDPTVENEAAAFNRDFALVRGPIDMILLAYKGDVVGMLPKNDFSVVRLGRRHLHTREAVSDLKLFGSIEQALQ